MVTEDLLNRSEPVYGSHSRKVKQLEIHLGTIDVLHHPPRFASLLSYLRSYTFIIIYFGHRTRFIFTLLILFITR